MGDRYDNTVYTFVPGHPVVIPPQAAWHFFLWPSVEKEMKEHTAKRFGWDRVDHVGADRNRGTTNALLMERKLLADLYWENLVFEVCNG